MSFSLFIISTVFIGFLSYYLWIWSYWIRKGINGPRGFPFSGVMHRFQSHAYPAVFHFRDWTKKYGAIYGIIEGVQKTLVVSDPEFVNEVFVKQFDNFYGRNLNPIQGDPSTDKRSNIFLSQGHRWKRLRTLSSPTFSNSSLKKIMGTVQESVTELMEFLDKGSAGGKTVDMLEYYQEYTLDVIGKIAMGQTDSMMFRNPLLAKLKATFPSDRGLLFLISGIFPIFGRVFRKLFSWFPTASPIFDIQVTLENAVKTRIAQRESDSQSGIELGEPQDFIDLFLDARSDEEFLEVNESFDKANIKKVDKQLTLDEITGQLLLFLLAGFDTTALSLSYATYLLATHPEIQKKLQEEVDRECPDPEITFDQLSKLKYTECVMKETLRMYPMASIFHSRKCMKTTNICGMEIEEGVNFQADTWTLHYDPKIWGDDVKEFKPERWLSPDDHSHKGAYLPFGLGARVCIAVRLANMEMKMMLAYALKKYTFETAPETDIPLKLSGRTTIAPRSVALELRGRDMDFDEI